MRDELHISLEFLRSHPQEAASILDQQPIDILSAFLKAVPDALLIAVVPFMDPLTVVPCLEAMAAERAAAIITGLQAEAAVMFLRRMDEPARAALFDRMPAETAASLKSILEFAAGTAGAVMNAQLIEVTGEMCAAELLTRVRKYPQLAGYCFYVTDRRHQLLGVVYLSDALAAPENAEIASMMRTDVVHISAFANRAAIIAHPGWRQFQALPVVDASLRLLGVIRYETLRRLELEVYGDNPTKSVLAAGSALADLYRIGLSGLVKGVIPKLDQDGS